MFNNKAATETKELKIGSESIQIEQVKGQPYLFRISINQRFKGYIEKKENEYHKVEGYTYHELIFARICHFLKN